MFRTGFQSWVSEEIFDGKGSEKYGDDMGESAKKAFQSVHKLLGEAGGAVRLLKVRMYDTVGCDKRRVQWTLTI